MAEAPARHGLWWLTAACRRDAIWPGIVRVSAFNGEPSRFWWGPTMKNVTRNYFRISKITQDKHEHFCRLQKTADRFQWKLPFRKSLLWWFRQYNFTSMMTQIGDGLIRDNCSNPVLKRCASPYCLAQRNYLHSNKYENTIDFIN